ncbi:hypothetical protein [Polaromonas sp. CG9_12]|nr:hypothetical protein [Polaromonas sp. CG9_12]
MGGPQEAGKVALLIDSAYEGDATRELAQQLGFVPVAVDVKVVVAKSLMLRR